MREADWSDLKYTPALDGLRALAVLLVVCYHARGDWFPGGFIGVDVFFVLSGFLISRLLISEHRRSGRVAFGNFYMRRALRLLPALVVVCIVVGSVCLLLPVRNREETLFGVLTSILYVSSPFAAAGRNLGDMLPTWSLSVEEYFYFIWPVLLVLLLRARRPLVGVAALCAGAVLYRWTVPTLLGWDDARISYALDTRLEQLFIGALLAIALPLFISLARRGVAVAAAIILALFVIAPISLTHQPYMHGVSTGVAILSALLVAFAMRPESTWLHRTLQIPPLVWVGKRSYGIYLWHVPLISIIALTGWSSSLQLVVKLALIFLIPALSFKFLETPFLNLKSRFATRREPVGLSD